MFRNLSIRGKLIFGFILVAFLPMILLSLILFRNVKSEMINTEEKNILSVIKVMKRSFDHFTSHNLEYVTFMSKLPQLETLAEDMLEGSATEKTKQGVRDILRRALLSNREFDILFFLHPETGEVLTSSNPEYEGMFFNRRPYFQLGKIKPVVYRIHYSYSLEKNTLALAAPLISGEKLYGIVVAWLKISELNRIVESQSSVRSYLVTRSNIHILNSAFEEEGMPFHSGVFSVASSKALTGETGSGIYLNHNDVEVVGAYTFLEDLDLALISEVPLKEVLAKANREGIKFLAMTSGIGIIVFLAAIFMGNHITDPIIRLTRVIKKFGDKEDVKEIMFQESGKEVAQLTKAFNKMVSRRRVVEEALKNSEKSYRTLAENIPSIVYRSFNDGKNRIQFFNRMGKKVTGYEDSELSGGEFCPIENFIHPEDRPMVQNKIRGAVTKGESFALEYRFIHKDGSIMHFWETSTPVYGSNRELIFIDGVINDITDLKKAEDTLREREQQLQMIIDTEPECVKILTPDGILMQMNPAGLAMIEADSVEQVKGQPVYHLIAPEYRDAFRELNERVSRGEMGSLEFEMIGLKGARRWLDTHAVPLRDFQNNIIGILGVTRDVTEHREVLEQLQAASKRAQEEKAKVDAIIAGMGDGISIQDTNFKILYQNEVHKSFVGEHVGEYCFQAYEKRSDVCENCPVDMAYKDGEIHTTERTAPNTRGLSYFEITASPLKDPTGKIIAGIEVVRDITDRKYAEIDRECLLEELARKNKELEQVLYVSSHDLRSPLVNIEGFSKELEFSLRELTSILREREFDPDSRDRMNYIIDKDIPESVKYILSSIKKMDVLLAGLLRLSRLGRVELKKERLDMNKLISDVVKTFEYRFKETGVEPEISELPACMGDEAQINQVFSNLIDNAIKYMDENRPGIIRVYGYRDGNYSVYCVEDNGRGIEPDLQTRIFEIFQRLDPKTGKGEGLGLTIAYRIVERHNGKISVDSLPGKGSKFFVSLPSA